jgi:hypothetical protein
VRCGVRRRANARSHGAIGGTVRRSSRSLRVLRRRVRATLAMPSPQIPFARALPKPARRRVARARPSHRRDGRADNASAPRSDRLATP